MHYKPLKPARIEYRGNVPVSLSHDDPYFSLDNGLAETRHVFLDGCRLPAAWQDRDQFTILETGFGTGLNFLATWQQWRRHRSKHASGVLYYISVEAHPLDADQIRRAISPWPELTPLIDRLVDKLPPAIPGFHRLWYEEEGVCLTLLYGDVLDCLQELEATVDAIYLDGFAPSQNEDMWQPVVYRELSRLGREGAQLSTFTAAGAVRRGLASAGFEVHKVPGYGRKREMITARLASVTADTRIPGWLALPPASNDAPLVCGRGIAGAAAARAWQMRGISVACEDSQPERSASRNPLALVSPRLPTAISREGQLMLSAALYAKSLYQQSGCVKYPAVLVPETDRYDGSQQNTVLSTWQLPDDLLRPLAESEMARASAGQVHCGGLYSALGCAVETGTLLDRWSAESSTKHHGELTVSATGAALRVTDDNLGEFLHAMQGEVVYIDVDATTHLPMPVCGVGQLVEQSPGRWQLGSSYRRLPIEQILKPQQTSAEIQKQVLDELEPVPAAVHDARISGGRAAVRVRGADHLPLAGPVPDASRYREIYARLNHNARAVQGLQPPWLPGQWVLTGFGSHGYTFAPLLAELMVCQIRGEPWPLPRTLALAVHPARFLARALKRVPPERTRRGGQ